MKAKENKEQEIPVLKAEGPPYELGYQIGEQVQELARQLIEEEKYEVSENYDAKWDQLLDKSEKYLAYTNEKLPWVIQELKGYAQGAGINFKDLFLLFCIESKITKNGCTDIIVCPSLNEQDRLILAHNNDVEPKLSSQICIVKAKPKEAPSFLATAFAGLLVNAGVNSAGLGFGGNELTPNDARPGIPQALVFRAMYRSQTISEAIAYANMERRATSYNNIVGDSFGNAFSIEGSATDFDILAPEDGFLVHTNHYISSKMQKYESDPQIDWEHMIGYSCSVARYHRACNLITSKADKNITSEFIKKILSDHASRPHSICRHLPESRSEADAVRTVFSTIIHPAEKEMLFCPTNPCSGKYKHFSL